MLFLSIHPVYVELILKGDKTVELRRQRPRCVSGDWIAVYSTTPERCLRGVAQVKEVRVCEASDLWKQMGHRAGVTRSEYNNYFAGSKQAVGIMLANPARLETPIPLADLRKIWPAFQPPQSYRYLDEQQIKFLASRIEDARFAA